MLLLFYNLIYLGVFSLVFTVIFYLILKHNRLLFKTICVFLFLHIILVALILVEMHRFKTNLSESIFRNDGDAYSANAWQISMALTKRIPDVTSVAQLRGIHIPNRGLGVVKFYNEYIKKCIIPPVGEYEVGYITYFYSIIYASYGYMQVFIHGMNVFLHLFTAIVLYKSSELIFNNKIAAYIASLFFLLNPISFYYSSTKLRDPIIIFSIYFSIYCLIMILKGKRYCYAVLLPPLFIICKLIKDNYVLPLLIVFAAYSMAILFKRSKKIFFIFMMIVLLISSYRYTLISTKIKQHIKSTITTAVGHQMGFYTTGGSIYRIAIPDKDSRDYTLKDLAGYIFKGWYHLLNEPILSADRSIKLLLFFPFKVIFLILCVLAAPGILMAIKYGYTESVIFISMLIILGTGLAMSSGNVGSMLRHRDVITPAIFIFSAFYIARLCYGSNPDNMRKE